MKLDWHPTAVSIKLELFEALEQRQGREIPQESRRNPAENPIWS